MVHVVANVKFAKKCEEAGVDAIVAEGFEAGGHNGIEETTTMCLIPQVVNAVSVPVIAAGGIASGRSMLAAFALGAEGVQIGSRFVASVESSAHANFKQAILNTDDGSTQLALKKVVPVRLIKNKFYHKVKEAEDKGASVEELKDILGHGKAKLGMFEGNVDEGELEIGQASGYINEVKPAGTIVREIMEEFDAIRNQLRQLNF